MKRLNPYRGVWFTFVIIVAVAGGVGPAQAGMADLVNGVVVGKTLPAHELVYLRPPVGTEPRLRLLDFWATWCVPCREAVPRLNELSARFGTRGLAVIGVTKEGRDVVEAFLPKSKIGFQVALDQNARLFSGLKIRAIPYAILVAADGKIIWRGQPEELTDQMVEKFLGVANG